MQRLLILCCCIFVISCTQNDYRLQETAKIYIDSVNKAQRTYLSEATAKNGDRVILYSDSSWSIEKVPVVVTKNAKNKKAKKKLGQTQVQEANKVAVTPEPTSYQYASSPAVEPVRTRVVSETPTNYYSSTCGAPTKKGGACRRTVRGGGRCWQH